MEQAGVGLGRMEMQRIFLALKQLAQSEQLPHCRLWGKILGRDSNYIIAEAAYKEAEKDDELRSEELFEEEETTAEHPDNEEVRKCVCGGVEEASCSHGYNHHICPVVDSISDGATSCLHLSAPTSRA